MQKRGGLSALILLISIAICLAILSPRAIAISLSDKLIEEKYHFSGDSFIVDGDLLAVTHMHLEDQKIYFTVNNKSMILNNGDCYETDRKKFCLTDIFNDIAGAKTGDPIKFDGQDIYAGLRISVYRKALDVTVTRTFTPAKPLRDEPVAVELLIKNPTDQTAEFFKYEDIYPEGVIITSGAASLEKTLHGVKYEDNIQPQSEKIIHYTITITDYITFSNVASFNYTVNGIKKGFNTTKATFDLFSAKPYTYTTAFSPSSPETGEATNLKITVTNKKGSKLTFETIGVTIPTEQMSVHFDTNTFEKSGSQYYWTGTLDNGTIKELNIGLTPLKSGKINLTVNIRVKETDFKSYSESKIIAMSPTYKAPELILSIKEPTVSEGGLFRVAFSIKNNNKYTGFRRVNAFLNSNITVEKGGYAIEIPPGAAPLLIELPEITAPTVNKSTDFIFTASGSYDTTFENGREYNKTGKLTVTPINKSIFISQTIQAPKQVHVGDNLTVTVRIKHTNQEIVTADVGDTYSPELIPSGGTSLATIYFDNPTEKPAYIYNVVVPYNYSSTELFIKTAVSVREKPGIISKITILPVNLTRPIILLPGQNATTPVIQKNTSANVSIPSPATNEEHGEKVGTFTKIVNGVMDFVRRLFGYKD
jgi:hypothetical protein